MPSFIDKAREIASTNNSRIIFALDKHHPYKKGMSSQLYKEVLDILTSLNGIIAGVKIGLPTILTLGEDKIYKLINEHDWNFFFIADLKIADVSHINIAIVDHISSLGFDALISHAFIGYEDGVESTVYRARKYGLGILTVLSMTHKGADEIINKHFLNNLNISLKADVDGYIIPANKPNLIRYARKTSKNKIIASPGIGVQGSRFGSAINAGADFEIIGRSIYQTDSPREAAEKIRGILKWMK